MVNYGNPTNKVKDFHLFHILTKIWCLQPLILAILVGVQWLFFFYSFNLHNVVNDVEQIFI